MKAEFETLEIKGEKYPIVYNLLVSKKLQKEFGSLQKWMEKFETVERDEFGNIVEDKVRGIQIMTDGEVIKNDDGSVFLAKQKEIDIESMAITFKLMINEGIRQFNKDAVVKMNFLDDDDACELLGYINGADTIRSLVSKASPKATEEEGEPKNAQTEQSL